MFTDILELTKPGTDEVFYPKTHADAVVGLKNVQFFEEKVDPQDPTKRYIQLKEEYTGLSILGWDASGGVGNPGGGGGGIISGVYRASDLGTIYSPSGSEDLTKTFSAYAIDKVWQAVLDIQQTTPNVSLTNAGSYYTLAINGTSEQFYTKAQVDGLISGIQGFEPVVVSSLPSASASTMYKLYLVPSSNPQTRNVKDEYITIRSGSAGSYTYSWELIGSTAIDLSGYVTTQQLGNWDGSTNITTLGTITTGVWSGTAIGVTKGGTGLTSISKGAILYASAANTISALSANGTNTKKFLSQTSNNAPSWTTLSLDDVSDGSTRKLANYLPLTGGTMTGAITMSGANILTATDSANQIGSITNRFGYGFFRNLYTSYFGFRSGSNGNVQYGHIGSESGYMAIYLENGNGVETGQYMFNAEYGFFHGGNGTVACGLSSHRWSKVWTVDIDLSGNIVPSSSHSGNVGTSTAFFAGVYGDTTHAHAFELYSSDSTQIFRLQGGKENAGTANEMYYALLTLHQGTGEGLYINKDTMFGMGTAKDLGKSYARWKGIYGASLDLTGSITLAAASHIDIGPARIEYDSDSQALHITTNQTGSSAPLIGLWIDGFDASGGIGASGSETIYGSKTFDAKATFNGGIDAMGIGVEKSGSYMQINCSTDRLYIQRAVSQNLVLTTGTNSHTIIGSYTDPGNYKFYVNGSSRGTAWDTTSDARLKDKVHEIWHDDAISKIMRLRPVTWVWNKLSSLHGKASAGLIAQEVEDVIPQMVTDGEYKGLNYAMLHAYEIATLQSHEERIRTLEEENKELREEIRRLRA